MNNIHLYNTESLLDIPNTTRIKLENLDTITDASVDEFYIQDILDTVSPTQHSELLQKIKQKLTANGFLFVQAPDIKQLAVALILDKISVDMAQMVLYKDKLFVHTAKNTRDILELNDYKIVVQKYINIFEYFIQASL
jgi:trans-aconitate methyltransferase